MVECFKLHATNFKRYYKLMGQQIKKLVKVRNQILTLVYDLKHKIEESECYDLYEKSDIFAVCDIVAQLKGSKYVQPHFLWDIPVRDPNSSVYDDCELSE